jgi:fucose 4-O-acetylase-like acetyltransferase
MKHKHLDWIDWSKTIGIGLVIFGHLSAYQPALNFIYAFHMPFFFFVSAVLAKTDSVQQTAVKSFRQLLQPYLMYGFISIAWWLAIVFLRHPETYPNVTVAQALVRSGMGLLLGVGYDTPYSYAVNAPLWFLVGLFWVKIIHALLAKCQKSWCMVAGSVLAIGVSCGLSAAKIDWWLSLDSALMVLPFYAIGFWGRHHVVRWVDNTKMRHAFLCALVLGGVLALTSWLNGRVDVNHADHGGNVLLFYINGLLGTALLILVAKLLSKFKFKLIALISSGTLLIMALHPMLISLMFAVFKKWTFLSVESNVVIALIVLLGCTPLIKLATRFWPLLLGKARGVQK